MITFELAIKMLQFAQSDARKNNYRPMGIVIVDAASHLVASARELGASALRLDIAIGKANAVIGMGINSRTLAQRAVDMPVFFGAIAATSKQSFIPQTGALLIKSEAGEVLGAIGASGGTGDEDEQICKFAIDEVGLVKG